jgi:glycosyltransferase involved in cell wall biosynthesis
MQTCVVVVPTLNEADTLGQLVRSVLHDPYPAVEVVVVDGGSTDGTPEVATSAGATVLEERGDHGSPAEARNQGAEFGITELDADVLCFLDGDLELSPNFIERGMAHFVDSDEVVAVKTVADAVRDSVLMKVFSPIADRARVEDTEPNAPPPPPAHFFQATVFEGIGGFPPLGFREDWIITNRAIDFATENGQRVELEPACVRYGHLDSLGEYIGQRVWYGRTFVPYVEYVGPTGLKDLFVLTPLAYVGSLLALVGYPLVPHRLLLLAGVPFVLKLAALLVRSLRYRAPYVVPHLFLSALGNLAFVFGIIRYLVGDRRLTRGS